MLDSLRIEGACSARILARTAPWSGLAASDLLSVESGSSDWLISFAISSISFAAKSDVGTRYAEAENKPGEREVYAHQTSFAPRFGRSIAGTILPANLSVEDG